MRLRVHDDGRWAVDTGCGHWTLFRDGVPSHVALRLHEPGWHEAVALPLTEAAARRLATAMGDYVEVARAVLDRLSAGDGEEQR